MKNRPINKLATLSAFLQDFGVENDENGDIIQAIYTTSESDATSRLHGVSGFQIITARPELHGDLTSATYDTVIFVLAPDLGASKTTDTECARYNEGLLLVDQIVNIIEKSCSEGACERLLAGFELKDMDITPETSLFGGWQGWSIELSFE